MIAGIGIPASIYLFKVKNGNTRTMCKRHHWRLSVVCIVNFEQITHVVLVFPLFNIEQVNVRFDSFLWVQIFSTTEWIFLLQNIFSKVNECFYAITTACKLRLLQAGNEEGGEEEDHLSQFKFSLPKSENMSLFWYYALSRMSEELFVSSFLFGKRLSHDNF